jgi:simple sugar transport system permease protein
MGLMSTVATRVEDQAPLVRDRAEVRRRVKLTVTFAIVSAFLVYFASSIENATVDYIVEASTKSLPAKPVAWTAAAVALLATVVAALDRFPKGWQAGVGYAVVGLAFYFGFIVWAYSDQADSGFQSAIANPIPGTIRIATPLILGALAGVMCERSGVINIAIEGQFLVGAFFASVAASLAFSAYMGLVGAILAGVGLSALLAVFSLRAWC